MQGQKRDTNEPCPVLSSSSEIPKLELLSPGSVCDFYRSQLIPAFVASLPMLVCRLLSDFKQNAVAVSYKAMDFLTPSWWSSPLKQIAIPKNHTAIITDVVMRYFEVIKDIQGLSKLDISHIKEQLQHMEEHLMKAFASSGPAGLHWFHQAWPMLDWKIGIFLWRSCGGLLLLLGIATIVPGRLHGISGRILRWPILAFTYLLIAVELTVYVTIRIFIRLAETLVAKPKHRFLREQMAAASTSFASWHAIAKELDQSKGRDKWQFSVEDETSTRYNWAYIKELIAELRTARNSNDLNSTIAVLSQCSRKNVGGIMEPDLFSYTHSGETKHIVSEFIHEVCISLRWITAEAVAQSLMKKKEEHEKELAQSLSPIDLEKKCLGEEDMSVSKVISTPSFSGVVLSPSTKAERTMELLPPPKVEAIRSFLKRARAAYGRTALCLSGGGMMANCHCGVIKALLEEDCLPHVISGTSAGSVLGSLVCTRTDAELVRDLRPEIISPKQTCFSRSWMDRIKSLYTSGHMFDGEEWYQLILWFTCGEMTFEEAYKKTGRVLCISLSATTKKAPPVLLNYITAPNVVIASAIIASAAVPGFISPVRLKVKNAYGLVTEPLVDKSQTYWDGSIQQDIPISGLAEMLNCQFFIASQCNPHIVPFFFNTKGDVGRPCRWSSGLQHDSWRGGFLLSALEMYIKNDMRAKFRFLDDLEAAVGFTSSLFTQSSYGGQTTIVPELGLPFYLKIFTNPSLRDMKEYFQVGLTCTYPHIQMIKLHYAIARALDECLLLLESETNDTESLSISTPRRSSERVRILYKQRNAGVNVGDLPL